MLRSLVRFQLAPLHSPTAQPHSLHSLAACGFAHPRYPGALRPMMPALRCWRATHAPRSVVGWCAILLLVPSFGDRGGNTDPIRISDAERNDAAERLNAFFAEGRLDLEECSSRLDEVNAARTDVELDNAFRGLPKPTPPSQDKVVRRDFRARAERVVAIATPGVACTVIWAFTGHSNYWPEWVWLATGIAELRRFRPSRRRRTLERLGRPAYSDPPPIATDGHDRRMVLTAVFVDIVDSTEKAAALGDSRWRERTSQLRTFG